MDFSEVSSALRVNLVLFRTAFKYSLPQRILKDLMLHFNNQKTLSILTLKDKSHRFSLPNSYLSN